MEEKEIIKGLSTIYTSRPNSILLCFMLDRSDNGSNEVSASLSEISTATKLSTKQVRDAIKALMDIGYIEKVSGGNSKLKPTTYKCLVCFEKIR